MNKEQEVLGWLKAREGEMALLLEQLVNCDSGSHDKAGVDAVGDILKSFYTKHGLTFETLPMQKHGDVIKVHLPKDGSNDTRPVMLMGHRDTVFPKGEAARRPFKIVDGRGYGPGVIDMKAGQVINAFIMAALRANNANTAPMLCLITGDEEIGSPASRPVIEATAKEARCVFNSEPSRIKASTQTQIVNGGRKGGVFMRMEVKGKAAHSGNNYRGGHSAILEIAQKTTKLMKLTNFTQDYTVNVGTIGGGQTVNTIAPSAWCEFDLRYVTPQHRNKVMEKIYKIVNAVYVEGTSTIMTIISEFVPLVVTKDAERLHDIHRQAGRELGIEVTAEFSGGCADSGFTSLVGCPTICSVGPSGGEWHSDREYIEMKTLLTSTQTLALSVMRVAI